MLANFTEDKDLGQIRVIASDMDCTLLADDGSMPPHMDDLIRKLERQALRSVRQAAARTTHWPRCSRKSRTRWR